MQATLTRGTLVVALLIALTPAPVSADRFDDITRWADGNFQNLYRDIQTVKQLLKHEEQRRDQMSSELRSEQWNQQKRNIDTFNELRKRLRDIERRLQQQEQIIKRLAAQR